jgi:mitochondrial enoyl-[acyl-carrier protein] reductase / trans-2-enoyl-CoA reductase
MKAIGLVSYGDPMDAVAMLELPDAGSPGPGEVLVDLIAAPVHPAHVLQARGFYGVRPELPAVIGEEGVGTVAAVGRGVDDLTPGDVVAIVPLEGGLWAEQVLRSRDAVVPLPADTDPLQAAMIGTNPITAIAMLDDIVALEPGDWIIQNGANSAVGHWVIAAARRRGLHCVNVVRREDAVATVTAAGGDHVLVDGADLRKRVPSETGGALVRLGLDVVGGDASHRLVGSVADGGVVVAYGGISGEPMQIAPPHVIFRNVTVRGFWLVTWLRSASAERVAAVYAEAVELLEAGVRVPIGATYSIDEYRQAVARVAAGEPGKTLLTFAPFGPEQR